jgi:hypothetical protein
VGGVVLTKITLEDEYGGPVIHAPCPFKALGPASRAPYTDLSRPWLLYHDYCLADSYFECMCRRGGSAGWSVTLSARKADNQLAAKFDTNRCLVRRGV